MQRLSDSLIVLIGLLAILVAGYSIYLPGVSGPFLFDDFPNLSSMGDHGGVQDLETLLAFVFNRDGGLGRPLSMLSFLVDGQTWPTDPEPFKHTNILLHLLNGVLIFALARQLGARFLGARGVTRVEYIALATCAIWLLHPMHVSASMQVVQRMTLLMSAFTLSGLILYIYGRTLLERSVAGRGYFWMSVGVGFFGVLATLSKENGILIVLYALVVEFTAFRGARTRATLEWKLWVSVFCGLPLVALVTYIGLSWEGMLRTYEYRRHFGPAERLLTQAPILIEYLQGIVVPRASGLGLFHDDQTVSRSLIDPWYTLPAVLFLLATFAGAFALRRRAPLLAFAILWFFAGHALESTVIPLELYYEHRNYLPMFGIPLALACGASQAGRGIWRIALLGGLAFLLLEAVVGLQSTYTWGKPGLMATVWARENPESSRAQQYAAEYWAEQGALDRALMHIERGIEHNPQVGSLRLQRVMFNCYLKKEQDVVNQAELSALRSAHYDTAVFGALERLQQAAARSFCDGVTFSTLGSLIDALKENPRYSKHSLGLQNLIYRQARMNIQRRRLDTAIALLDEAYDVRPDRDIPIEQAVLLASAGLHCDARRYALKALSTERKQFRKYQMGEAQLRDFVDYLEGEAGETGCVQ